MSADENPDPVNPQVLSIPELTAVVIAARKQGLSGTFGGWTDYLKAKLPQNTLKDPARHGRETLAGFVQSLVDAKIADASPAVAAPAKLAAQAVRNSGVPPTVGSKTAPSTPVTKSATPAPQPASAPAAKKAKTQPSAAIAAAAAATSVSQPPTYVSLPAATTPKPAAASTVAVAPHSAAAPAATASVAAEAGQQAHLASLEASLRRAQEHAATAAAEVLRLQREIDALRQTIAGGVGAVGGCHATDALETPSTSANTLDSLVARTLAHPNFKRHFNLPSTSAGWTRTGRLDASAASPSTAEPTHRLLALDCEMVKTDEEDNALAGVCVIDEHYNVLFKSVVVPEGRVVDYRTPLTGLTADDFKDVSITRRGVQEAIGALLSPGTVLVGHALHHDLAALKIDHQPVVDTSLIFSYLNMRALTPSLKDLAKVVLGVDMRTGASVGATAAVAATATTEGTAAATALVAGRHDSREDACVAMRLVVHELAQATPTVSLPVPDITVPKEDLAKLLLHALPADVTEAELRAFLGPTLVSIEGAIASRKVLAVFRHASAANEVFKALPGQLSADCMGRASKQVLLAGGVRTVTVRKMSCHNGRAYKPDKPNQPARGGHKRPRNGSATPGGGARGQTAGAVKTASPAGPAAAGGAAGGGSGGGNDAKAKGKRRNKKVKLAEAAPV